MNDKVITILAFILIIIVVYFGIIGNVTGGLWYYSLNTWLTYFNKPNVNYLWPCYFLGIIPGVNGLSVPISIMTFIVHLFL